MIDFVAHGVTLSLAWLAAINAASSALVVGAAQALLCRKKIGSPALWLLLRLAPAALSLLFVSLLFIPSYWQFEPRESIEEFDRTMTAMAALAAVLLAVSAARGFVAWRSASRRVDRWMRKARPMVIGTTPCFVVDGERPMIALSGLFRHRLLVTRSLVDALTEAELAAAIAHELGHRRALDNLKRLAIRSTPDFIGGSRAARDLERRWASAAEHVADSAAGIGASTRCALASALVKVARLTSGTIADEPAPLAEPISTLIGGGEIASRVQLLLEDHDPARGRSNRLVQSLALAIGASVPLAAYGPLLRLVHDATETLIRMLP